MRAAVDVGTNTVRAVIANVRGNGRIEPVRYWRRITRLGGCYNPEAGLSEDARRRTLDALKEIASLFAETNISEARVAGTAILRDALNGQTFAEEVREKTGLPLRVIEGIEEARLTALGVRSALDPVPDHALIMDIGGGSTEFILLENGRVLFANSYPLGVVNLCESFPDVENQQHRIDQILDSLTGDLRRADLETELRNSHFQLIGTAGTVTTLAALHLEMDEYDWRRINNASLSREDLEAQLSTLAPLTVTQRENLPGLERGRGDLILPGLRIVLAVMRRFGASKMTVSDFGLLEGLLLDGEPASGN